MIRTNHKVALYARFSSDNQRTESIDAQLRAMKNYCKAHNYIITKIYTDEAKSATTDKRPAFQEMIADSSSHLFNMVLVHKLDRFARNRYDSAVYKRELKKNGVIVCSVLENLDSSPESIMMESVLEGMSEYYSQNLAREVMKGMKETALQCKHTGGKPPLGYDVDEQTKQLIINPYEAETVQLIFDMYSRGYGYSAILEALHSQDRRTKRGKEFMKNSLYSILTNPKYKGIYVYNRSSAKDINGRRNTHLYKNNEDIIAIDGGCPQIVDRETYEKVQDILITHKQKGGRMNAKEN
ncbi:MAG: recombinase family protein [Ruminococcaceae bacterium]|nr:recombinase family protein [Oscillospiraceae bacterium]